MASSKFQQSSMIKIIPVILFSCMVLQGLAQPTLRQAELKPIYHSGGRYYYDGKRLDGGAYGVQVPLMSLQDDEINRRYKTFRTLRIIGGVASTIPLFYILFENHNHQLTRNEFWTIFGAGIITGLTFNLIGNHHLNKGIDRYNMLIIRPSGRAPGLSLIYKF